MEHLFIPYELAIIAKEKGFNEPCIRGVKNGERWANISFDLFNQEGFLEFTLPLHQQIIDWLRDNHNIELGSPKNIIFNGGKRHFRVSIYKIGEKKGLLKELSGFNEYYEALNEAIKQALKLI
jgi:hypothetical protein